MATSSPVPDRRPLWRKMPGWLTLVIFLALLVLGVWAIMWAWDNYSPWADRAGAELQSGAATLAEKAKRVELPKSATDEPPPPELEPLPVTVADSADAAGQPAAPAAPAVTRTASAPQPPGPRSPYKGFWYGLRDGEQLAVLIENHLRAGKEPWERLDEAKCRRDGSCASPMNYLEAFRAYDPNAGLTKASELPGYIRGLVMDCSIKGRFMMADIHLPDFSRHGRTETGRMSRFVKAKECVLKNPKTGRPVIAMDCANPVGKQVAPPPRPRCVEVKFNHFYPGDGDVIWSVGSDSGPLRDDRCNRMRQGDSGWTSWGRECHKCIPPVWYLQRIFARAAAYFHPHRYKAVAEEQTISFSEEVWGKAVNICLSNEVTGAQTNVVHIRPEDWRRRHTVVISDELWVQGVPPRRASR